MLADIPSIMRNIESDLRQMVAPGVIVNCVLGAQSLAVDANPTLIKSVMSTFADNAARFTSKGSITFGFDINGDELYFYVKDTGIGVPSSAQDELFDESFGSDTSLIKALHIVSDLGGEIGVDSRGPGKGSTFWFTIPYTAADEPETAQQPEQWPASQPLPPYAQTHSQPRPEAPRLMHDSTILIAEDNESNYALFRSILESRYNLIRAHNGQEAVDLFQQNARSINLILMDINMPIKDGYEATRDIRAISSTVPIVAVTAYAFTTDKQRIYENGFNAYISKPISINRLERVITNLMQN